MHRLQVLSSHLQPLASQRHACDDAHTATADKSHEHRCNERCVQSQGASAPTSTSSSSLIAPNTTAAGRSVGIGSQVVDGIQHSPLRWDGWGYADTAFVLDPDTDLANPQQVRLSGSRYLFSGKTLPSLRSWFEANVGIDVKDRNPGRDKEDVDGVPPSIINQDFVDAVAAPATTSAPSTTPPTSTHTPLTSTPSLSHCRSFDTSPQNRLFHSHGHTCQEIFQLRYGKFDRVVDAVIYPRNTSDVQHIVAAAHKHDVALIPYGGGTSVTQALMVPTNERRMTVSVDMHLLNTITISRYNMTARIGAGCVGRDLEQYLNARGLTMGHEPDSMEFSTLGGWISTRASGMRKTKYGNIEDILINSTLITPTGKLERVNASPRVSHGPDLNHLVLGSEGVFGIITEATVKVRPLPPHTQYGSIIFPHFELALKFMYDLQLERGCPVSCRLVDNVQFKFGMALKPPADDWLHDIKSKIQKWYVTQRLHFDPDNMVACTLLFEGTKTDIKQQEKKVYSVAARHGGIKAGEENGIRGYFLTYMIAYLRDFGFNYSFIAESFETSLPWDKLETICNETKQRIVDTAAELGVKRKPFVSCRVTQLYDAGPVVYFYFGFVYKDMADPVHIFNQIEHAARDEILSHGGSLSHHHGVGKLRKYATQDMQGEMGMQLLKGLKQKIDPKNVFASGNLFDV